MPIIISDVGKVLVNQEKLTFQQYQDLKKQAEKDQTTLEQVILKSKIVEYKDFLLAKAESLGLNYVSLENKQIKREVLQVIPANLAKNYQILAIDLDKSTRVLSVAMVEPKDSKALEALRFIARELEVRLEYFLTDVEGLKIALKQYENIGEEVDKALKSAKERYESMGMETQDETKTKSGKELEEVIKHAPVAKMVYVILRHAVEGKASDIHIEPMDNFTRVRYRIDGALSTSITLPLYIHDAVVARVKVMANLKIDETRIPQDGRIRIEMQDRDVEFRLSTLPLQEHEKVVMRVLDTGGSAPALNSLGYIGRNLDVIRRNLTKPNGMILVTGPTGSGKSMTLFSCLNIINSEDVNISTLEDPVEYRLPGVNHSQIHPQVGFTFASGLRALLRQDPNIIMVGEIRDYETAELAIHAAMTGHLVLSTLHTNSAIDSIPRLLDMKIEPYLLSTTLNVLIAQRLVKTICADCKEEITLDASLVTTVVDQLKELSPEALKGYGGLNLEKPVFYRGRGCPRCGQSGFKGRISICEIIENTASLTRTINSGMKPEEVQKALQEQDFITMRQDGFVKCLLGYTAPEEVLAVTKAG
ncbi:MAG: hypothetical protein A2445_04615 [Candidatus Jacksonbacteria bacterium RIFOXYC2_FULL_44_29]|nr:MAG: Type II secretion system protein E (GspE) [Parcubacteria group bacterium GW2011_GWA2_42_28]KKT53894.1 MAG: Type II secretion system protein E (GspE) [Parcubacteria group bacterium GW2011_GWC2_44_22]OGY75770.1 MAG: hypothetical protein A2295_03220 [Candidatus Jacksonbacteria bacterium RIFOXYB2_FULL_44_15]OGY76333.1 MAG: hypothetical protein A2240_04180 [Candidatus Jacksonbacteria bacterium RIFOXYA2_FULL_43_12]OGY78340.1 MAG: hypothetical protein A2445_04615 [Candidatus Jacksonbacteria ba